MSQNKKEDFFFALQDDLGLQRSILQQELDAKLNGITYIRETSLAYIFPNVQIRSLELNNVKKHDINYTLWIIGELKGKLEAQISHRALARSIVNFNNYDKDLHVAIIGALQAEATNLSQQLEQFKELERSQSEETSVVTLPKSNNTKPKAVSAVAPTTPTRN